MTPEEKARLDIDEKLLRARSEPSGIWTFHLRKTDRRR